MTETKRKIMLLNPRGFCVGVKRAIATVEKALIKYGQPIYVLHQIVHNERVIEELEKKGVVFQDSLDHIPDNSVTIFSAHGVSPRIREQAKRKKLKIIDATCPLVAKVHEEARKFYSRGYTIIYLGSNGHQEVRGIMGEAPMRLVEKINDIEEGINVKNSDKVVCLAQTTFSLDNAKEIIQALRQKFPKLVALADSDICRTTRERQTAVKKISKQADAVLIIGSKVSNNTLQLVNAAKQYLSNSYIISNRRDINKNLLARAKNIAITSGASTPEMVVKEIVEQIKKMFLHAEIVEIGK